jgi:DNA processing protein
MSDDELRALLWLKNLPGLADTRLNPLLREYATAQDALQSPRWGVREKYAQARRDAELTQRVEHGCAWVRSAGARVLTQRSDDYPAAAFVGLDEDAPAVLFALGDLSLLRRTGVAVIGSRENTEYGARCVELLVPGLAARGIVIVSGLALGIDGLAHAAALQAGGATIAVLGCGPDRSYPPAHTRLQERIVREGLLLSEFAPGSPALPHHFPQRNRIIAALAHVLLVVEATQR